MGLPKIDMPIFEIDLPSTGEKIKYRQFTVKEEKILLTARETEDLDQILLATKQVMNNCLIDKNVDDLAMFDLEYLLLQIRAQSVDDELTFSITDPDTDDRVELNMSLDTVTLQKTEGHSKELSLSDDYTLIMRYPHIDETFTILKAAETKNPAKIRKAEFAVMLKCMDKLVGGDQVFKFADFSDEEITQFIDSLDGNAAKKMENFFKTMPVLRHELPYTNSKGDEKTFVVQGLETFFT